MQMFLDMFFFYITTVLYQNNITLSPDATTSKTKNTGPGVLFIAFLSLYMLSQLPYIIQYH